MLALQQAHEVRASIVEYLRATFSFKDKATGKAFKDFTEAEEEGLFRGPYISVKLPFVRASEADKIPLEIIPPFPPFHHQSAAFKRLTTEDGHEPQPTFLTTGTGSGKTESFLYPLLDYCHRHAKRQGIKAIILYPMNALATDQAGRLAEAIHKDPKLKGKIRAGLFIGSAGANANLPNSMGETHIIEEQKAILDSPPDILLTNFKMLDYALMRHKYHDLWEFNLGDPEMLKFLVLDELHTYDGAQGTDVANLLRRLKLKLKLPKGHLCPVGTSATIGSGEDAPKLLAEYAQKVFGEVITEEAIIGEERESLQDFFGKEREALDAFMPDINSLRAALIGADENYEKYLTRQKEAWGLSATADNTAIGKRLLELRIVWDILDSCNAISHITEKGLEQELHRKNVGFKVLPERDGDDDFSPRAAVITSLLALVAESKTQNVKGDLFPFLYLQVQIWIRELSGIQRLVVEEPVFVWRDNLSVEQAELKMLPPYFCRDCGASGWLANKHNNRDHFESDINDIYNKYFSGHKNIFFVNYNKEAHKCIATYEATDIAERFVSKQDLHLYDKGGANRIDLVAYRQTRGNYSKHICPECNGQNSLAIIGTRTATLTSIASAQVISSDLDKQDEKDRKVLAFANGVQDAAHQAGFIEARNFRFTFRTALQKVINEIGEKVLLSDLQTRFIDYWKANADDTGGGAINAYCHKFFPSDKVGKVNLESYRKQDGNFNAKLVREFDFRTSWDIASEFSYNALIGRTLEKTRNSAAHFDEEKLDKVFGKIQAWLEENGLYMISKADFDKFMVGLLHRFRTRGGVGHPYLEKFRTNKLASWELNWNKDKRHFLNKGFGPSSRMPRLITTQRPRNTSKLIIDTTFTEKENWHHRYFTKSFQNAPNDNKRVNEFFIEFFNLLSDEEIGIAERKESVNLSNYSLRADALWIENKTAAAECNRCNHKIYTTATGASQLEGVSCSAYDCSGHYELLRDEKPNSYYQRIYNRKRTARIYASDHTGLLPRAEREFTERDFKERPRFNSLNTLVATSTLEMGIDIGDLNTGINTSVPPLPANFLQRVGRAGRKSGSALLINFAGNDKHDQFYFAEPIEMMNGKVHPPGCFLEAKEILKRHFFAFCIDSWTVENPEDNRMPNRLLEIKPISVDLNYPGFFTNRLLQFITDNERRIFAEFKSGYGDEVSPDIFTELKELLSTRKLYKEVRQAMSALVQEYRAIRDKRYFILKDRKERNLGKHDEEYIELSKQLNNLRGTLKKLGRRQLLEHFTNVGLLPNYAFPETGVTLKARVVKNKSVDSETIPIPKDIEIVRPARQAIKELIPDNWFYSQGYKMHISGLTVLSWEEESMMMRYCSLCDYLEETEAHIHSYSNCPKCGDESFASVANQHRFLYLNAVKSFNKSEDAALDDSKDERENATAYRTKHFRFDKGKSQGAWAIKSVPFGIEYVKETDLYEVNSGIRKDRTNHSRTTIIDELEVPVSGYITCTYCGKSSSQTAPPKKGEEDKKQPEYYHYPYCKHKTREYAGKTDKIFEEVYLYRKMTTEMLKILLPIQEFEAESTVAMFMSGLDLGLRKFFKGNPQHIGIEEYKEANQKTGKFDRYVVLYDLVPGGTGYLSKLFKPENFNEVLESAYINIRDCRCKHHGKDGCYHCIFSYGNRYFQDELSRQKAEDLFYRLLRNNNKWEFLVQGIGSITNSGQIEESELEERFIRALRNYARQTERGDYPWIFSEEKSNDVVCYRLTIADERNRIEYFIQPQVQISKSEGSELTTIPDFLLRCLAADIDGKELSYDEVSAVLPIAVYLDGYQYHATKKNPRFEGDVVKRVSLLQSKQFLTWTLTYDDVVRFENMLVSNSGDKEGNKKKAGESSDAFSKQSENCKKVAKTISQLPSTSGTDTTWFDLPNSMRRLLYFMQNPVADKMKESVRTYLLGLQHKMFAYSLTIEYAETAIRQETSYKTFPHKAVNKEGKFYAFSDALPATVPDFLLQMGIKPIDLMLLSSLSVTKTGAHYDKVSWNIYWQLFNLLQLAVDYPADLVFSSNENKFIVKNSNERAEALELEADTADILIYYDEEYHEMVEKLLTLDISFSKDGSFIPMDENNNVDAEAVLGFPESKIVFGAFEDSISYFQENNYRILLPSECTDELLNEIKKSQI